VGCACLTKIKLDRNTIGQISFEGNAFRDCKNLEEILYTDNVTGFNEFGDWSFAHCTSLTSFSNLNSYANVFYVGPRAFYDCINLSLLRFVDSFSTDVLCTIENYAFIGCSANGSIEGGASVDARIAFRNSTTGKGTVENWTV
jgi:hypothetical protein